LTRVIQAVYSLLSAFAGIQTHPKKKRRIVIVRTTQIAAIDHALSLSYEKRLATYLRSRAPQFMRRFSNDELQQRISVAWPQARAFGLSSSNAIAQFVGLAIAAGPAFDRDPAVRNFMMMPGSAPDAKMQRLLEIVVGKLKQSAASKGRNG
jgi:hypothetical protein